MVYKYSFMEILIFIYPMYTHVHMATKTISITTDAYETLKSWKEGNESFSEIISKIGRKNRLSPFAGLLREQEATYLEQSVKDGRTLSRKRAQRMEKTLP